MILFKWIKNLFFKKGYEPKEALYYIKKDYNKYKVIKPSDREDFEEMFLNLAKNEIIRLNRLLKEEEINNLAQRTRIRQFQKKEKEGIQLSPGTTDPKVKQSYEKYKLKQLTKVNFIISDLQESIKNIKSLEVLYSWALENSKIENFMNNKREIADIEENIRSSLNELEILRKQLISLFRETKIPESLTTLINLWKNVGKNLQKARITVNNNEKVQILATINSTIQKEHYKITTNLIQNIKKKVA